MSHTLRKPSPAVVPFPPLARLEADIALPSQETRQSRNPVEVSDQELVLASIARVVSTDPSDPGGIIPSDQMLVGVEAGDDGGQAGRAASGGDLQSST